MKKLMSLITLGFVLSLGATAHATEQEELMFDEEATISSETSLRRDEYAHWKCSAQAPRLIRVFTVRREGYRSDVQQEALDECNDVAVLQCWPLGCSKLRR